MRKGRILVSLLLVLSMIAVMGAITALAADYAEYAVQLKNKTGVFMKEIYIYEEGSTDKGGNLLDKEFPDDKTDKEASTIMTYIIRPVDASLVMTVVWVDGDTETTIPFKLLQYDKFSMKPDKASGTLITGDAGETWNHEPMDDSDHAEADALIAAGVPSDGFIPEGFAPAPPPPPPPVAPPPTETPAPTTPKPEPEPEPEAPANTAPTVAYTDHYVQLKNKTGENMKALYIHEPGKSKGGNLLKKEFVHEGIDKPASTIYVFIKRPANTSLVMTVEWVGGDTVTTPAFKLIEYDKFSMKPDKDPGTAAEFAALAKWQHEPMDSADFDAARQVALGGYTDGFDGTSPPTGDFAIIIAVSLLTVSAPTAAVLSRKRKK